MKPLETRVDIENLIRLFYERVQSDDLLAPLFSHVNWSDHLPIMCNFWCSMILGDFSYQGQPFIKHSTMNLKTAHFERWQQLFHQTVEDHFTGDLATGITHTRFHHC